MISLQDHVQYHVQEIRNTYQLETRLNTLWDALIQTMPDAQMTDILWYHGSLYFDVSLPQTSPRLRIVLSTTILAGYQIPTRQNHIALDPDTHQVLTYFGNNEITIEHTSHTEALACFCLHIQPWMQT